MLAQLALLAALLLGSGAPASDPQEPCGPSAAVSDATGALSADGGAEPARRPSHPILRALKKRVPRREDVQEDPGTVALPTDPLRRLGASIAAGRVGQPPRTALPAAARPLPARGGIVVCWSSLSPPRPFLT